MEVHANNPSTCWLSGGLLWAQDQSGLHGDILSKTKINQNKKTARIACSWVVECSFSMHKALGSIPSSIKKKNARVGSWEVRCYWGTSQEIGLCPKCRDWADFQAVSEIQRAGKPHPFWDLTFVCCGRLDGTAQGIHMTSRKFLEEAGPGTGYELDQVLGEYGDRGGIRPKKQN